MKRLVLISVFALFLIQPLSAQLTVQALDDQLAYESAIQQLIGFGVTITNVTVDCGEGALGLYQHTGDLLGSNTGIILSTGNIDSAIGPNDENSVSSSIENSPLTDVDLQNLVAGNLEDLCIVEFDLAVVGDILEFEFTFGSDEYPEFVCTPFNDVFGFFVSGPDPDGGVYTAENIATVGDEIISVNSINEGIIGGTVPNGCDCPCNPDSYVSNTSFDSTLQYDGLTTHLTTSIETVPNGNYHLKMAIADVTDTAWDSAIFISGGSFKSFGASSIETVDAYGQLFYPNPSQGELVLSAESQVFDEYKLYGKDGKLLWTQSESASQLHIPDHIPDGIFFLEFRNAEQSVFRKLQLMR